MAHRTTKRAGMYTETGRGSAVANVQKSKGISIVTKYKGLQDNKNDVVAVQDSLADVDNLYIDDNDLLSSRPPVKLYTPVHNEFPDEKCHSVRMWNIEGYVFRLMKHSTTGTRYYLVCDNKTPDPTVSDYSDTYFQGNFSTVAPEPAETEMSVSFAPIEEKIFIFMNASWGYFNTKNYRFYTDIDPYIYVPIRYNIVNGVYTKEEALNYLIASYRNRYHYGLASSIDFSSLAKWVRVYEASSEKLLYQLNTEEYNNKDFSSVMVYPRGDIKPPTYYDIVEIINSYGEKMPVILCWYEDDNILKYSVDGKNYTPVNLPDVTLVGPSTGSKPFVLSKDGSMIVCFATDGIYMMNIFDITASNYMKFEKHSYLENARDDSDTLINFDPSQYDMDTAGIIPYFYTENIYSYILLVDNEKWLCVSHMRAAQRVDGVSLTTEDFTIDDKICMCPRYLDYIDDNDRTPGPLVMYTCNTGIKIHYIRYNTQNQDVDDITGFLYQELSTYLSGGQTRQIFDIIWTGTDYRVYVDICISSSPTYYVDGNNERQADIEITAIYKSSERRIHFRKGSINRSDTYTQLKRAYKGYSNDAPAGTPNTAINTSLDRASVIIEWKSGTGVAYYIQHYYRWNDLPYGNTGTGSSAIAAPSMPSTVPDYELPVQVFSILLASGNPPIYALPLAAMVPFEKSADIWFIKDGRFWTTMLFSDTALYVDSYVGATDDSGPIIFNIDVAGFTHFCALQEYYFSFGRTLGVTTTKRNENNEFQLYIPEDNLQECISEITNLCPISTQYVGVFLEDSIWYAGMEYLNDQLVHKKLMKSKIPFGCKKGTDILVASDGQSIIFPTYRGIALLSPQDFVATTDPIIKYISDNIQNFYLRFYSEVMRVPYTGVYGLPQKRYNIVKTMDFSISFVTYKYWMFMYKRYCREVLLYDMRDNTWWTWTMPYPVVDMIFTERLYLLMHTAEKQASYAAGGNTGVIQLLCDLFVVADKEADLGYALENFPRIDPSVDDFEYEDELIPNTLNGDVRVVKDDTDDGSHIELDLPQSRIDWFLISQKLYLGALNNYKTITGINIVAKGLYEYGTKLAMKAFRNIDHPEESIDMNMFIKDLRTFVQRLNLMHTIFFQYKLSNTDDDKQRQAHIASLCVKYEIKEGVR